MRDAAVYPACKIFILSAPESLFRASPSPSGMA